MRRGKKEVERGDDEKKMAAGFVSYIGSYEKVLTLTFGRKSTEREIVRQREKKEIAKG